MNCDFVLETKKDLWVPKKKDFKKSFLEKIKQTKNNKQNKNKLN